MKNKLTVYGCGGAGISAVVNNRELLENAGANVVYVDSSDSNIGSIVDGNIYKIPGKVGSGGNQLENIETFSDSIPDILAHYPPSSFNIVVASSSGGSGSVLSIYLAKELVKRGYVTAIIMLTTSDSLRRINNTINVIKSLESISSEIEQPLVLMTHHQNADESRRSGDAGFYFNLRAMVNLFTNQFEDLDEMDITNFFFYNKVTKVPPQLVTLTVDAITEEFMERMVATKPPISIINLINQKYRDDAIVKIQSAYSKSGYDSDYLARELQSSHGDIGWCYYIDNQTKHIMLDRFNKLKTESQESNSASISKKINIADSKTATGGFVFED